MIHHCQPNGIRVKLRRAINRIPEYKTSIAVEEQHAATSELQRKAINTKRKLAKVRLVSRLKKQRSVNSKSGGKNRSKVVPVTAGMTEEKKIEAIRKMMSNVFQTSDRFKKAAERLNWAAIGIVQYDVFDRMVRKIYHRKTKMKLSERLRRATWATAAGGDGTQKVLDITVVIDWLQLEKSSAKPAFFTIKMKVVVSIRGNIENGVVTKVSDEDGVEVTYSNGDVEEYTPKKLKQMMALVEQINKEEKTEECVDETSREETASMVHGAGRSNLLKVVPRVKGAVGRRIQRRRKSAGGALQGGEIQDDLLFNSDSSSGDEIS